MKLCSVCDKKISGSWCKNCHRFVKTYQLPDGIYLNESHNPKNDENCTYHMPDPAIWNTPSAPRNTQTGTRNTQTATRNTQSAARNTQSATRNAQTGMRSTQTGTRSTQTGTRNTQTGTRNTQTASRNTQTAARNTQTYSGSTGTQKKKPEKNKAVIAFVVVIIAFYALFVAATTVMPFVMDVIDNVSSEKREEEKGDTDRDGSEDQEDKDQDRTDDREDDSSLAEAKRELEEIKRLAALQKLQTIDTDKDEEGWRYSYYNPEEIQELEFECNAQEHFELTFSGFMTWLEQNFDETYEKSENLDKYGNYLAERNGESWYSFNSCRDYLVSDYFGIRVHYDTAAETVHEILIAFMTEEDYTEFCYNVLKMLDPETDWTEKKFSKQIDEVLRAEEYMEIYSSDFLNIAAQAEDGVLSILYYPAY